MDGLRLDKWLWAARLFKTRGLAVEAIDRARVLVNGQPAKPSRELHEGDLVAVRRAETACTLRVLALCRTRGPASLAQTYYAETEESVASRVAQAQARRDRPEPSADIEGGRPTKRDRRRLADWNRWSASADGD